jgi:ABC-type branched-subunit amino acid transport system substrate-binding protein
VGDDRDVDANVNRTGIDPNQQADWISVMMAADVLIFFFFFDDNDDDDDDIMK